MNATMQTLLAYGGSFFGGIDLRVSAFVKPGTLVKSRGLWSQRVTFTFHSARELDSWLIRQGLRVKVKKGRGQRRNRRNRR